MKIALKLNVLLAKNQWRLTFCLPLYNSQKANFTKRYTSNEDIYKYTHTHTHTVEDKMLGASGFWLIKHSI